MPLRLSRRARRAGPLRRALRWAGWRFILLMGFILAACTGPYPSDMVLQPAVERYPLPDRTYLTFAPATGFAVEYFARDGTSALWAPHAGAPVPGVWRVEDPLRRKPGQPPPPPRRVPDTSVTEVLSKASPAFHGAESKLCRRYGARARADLPEQGWECLPVRRVAAQVVAVREGDIYELRSGRLPALALDRFTPPAQFDLLRAAGC
ncbi:hypothetical protein FDP22_09625 [Paroceanicella profunda]|uniref:Uncharacterized protein n=1 Tax=Paroceanicella profunda TaxID=2579971 RepID=A0A5B8FH52_9RHOB|nr:hypothetical protein [Paroceanicella profunda]QDL92011.1 hypothetical protein FDP22_09625 [Paroceanicella profunda]